MPSWTLFFGAIIATVLLIFLTIPLAPKLGLIDSPGGRKQHQTPTPIVGGICCFFSFLLFCFLFRESFPQHMTAYLASSCLLVATGLIDDRFNTSAKTRLAVQALAGAIVVFENNIYLTPPEPFLTWLNTHYGLLFLKIFTVFFIVGTINAFNMLDGADGLLGTVTLSICLPLCWILRNSDDINALLLLMSCLISFLFFNSRLFKRHQASVFMGDAGSMWVGFTMAWISLETSMTRTNTSSAMILWLLGFPIIETLSLIYRRIRKGLSPLQADREHFHHILQRADISTNATVFIIAGIALVISLAGYTLSSLTNDYISYLGLFLMLLTFNKVIQSSWKLSKLLKKY